MSWTERVRSIAVLRPAGLGDFIMSTPAFVALRREFPKAKITLLTMHSQNASQAAKVRAYAGADRDAPWIDLIRPHALDDVRVLPSIRSSSDLHEARRVMSEVRPDLVVQMFEPSTPYLRRLAKMALMFISCGAVRQIGWRQAGEIRPGRPPKVDPKLGHHVLGLMQFINELGSRPPLSNNDVVFDLRPKAAAEAWAIDWLSKAGLTSRSLIAVAPGAIHNHKQWPIEKFSSLIKVLLDQQGQRRILVLGTAKDEPLAKQLALAAPDRVHSLCGITTIAESAAIFSKCDLVVGNDGGAMHLADAMGAKVVSIVPGLEFPDSVEPWHNQDRAIRHPVPCAPCYSFTRCPEGHRRCMLDLPFDDVLQQCLRALAEPGEPGVTK